MDHVTRTGSDPRHETRRQEPGLSDAVRPGRTRSDIVGRGRTLSDERRDDHSLTSLEVAKRFEQSGIPRSQRSIERYCRDGKLDCFLDPDEDRYYATLASVETLIAQMKEIQARHGSSDLPPAGPHASPVTADEPPFSRGESGPSAVEELETLKRENTDLKITNRAKDYFIDELKADRLRLAEDLKSLVIEYGNANRQLGELQAHVRQLESPTDSASSAPATVEAAKRTEEHPPA